MSVPTGSEPTDSGPVGVGIIGAGVIAAQYLAQLTTFPDIDVRAIGDIAPEAAARRAQEFEVPVHGDVDVVLQDPAVEIVVNLTVPGVHFDVSRQILETGKHVWSEKPLTTDPASAQELLRIAEARGLRVGCAPDTVLGAGFQTALRILAAGGIGEPRSAIAMFHSAGPELWHPSPEFLFQQGAGPLFDMGPYYLTALVLAYGPITRVSAVGSRAVPERTIATGPKAGTAFPVAVPTQISALLRFASGANATVVLSFDDADAYRYQLELQGSEGTIRLPDPNVFDGPSTLSRRTDPEWVEQAAAGPIAGRGLGVLEMARAIRAARPHRLTGDIAAHVLDVMVSVGQAVDTGASIDIESTAVAPQPVPADFDTLARTL